MKRKETSLSSEAAAPELPQLLCELREFYWGVINDRTISLGATALWQAVTLEGRCLCCYTSHSTQPQWAVQSRDWFSLELTDFRLLENSKAAKDASCLIPATSISQALLQQQGHNKISCYIFIWTAEKDSHTSRILSCLHQHSFAHLLCLRLKEQCGRADMGPSVRILLLDRSKVSASPSEPPCPVQPSVVHPMIVLQPQFGSDITFLEELHLPFCCKQSHFFQVFKMLQFSLISRESITHNVWFQK